MPRNPVPLCVDLDGTLCKGDLTIESAFLLFKKRPITFFRFLPLLLKGKAPFKRAVAANIEMEVSTLPWNKEFLDFLTQEHARGRRILLVSASDEMLVKPVGDFHGIFEESVGSDGVNNLRSAVKKDFLVERFGEQGYDYAGNDAPDHKVWQSALNAIVVNARSSVERVARRKARVSHIFPPERSRANSIFRALRVHQWLKNLLVFVPLVLAHRVLEPALVLETFFAFLAFSFAASSIYLMNDAFDLEADRAHARKRARPLPSGDLQIVDAVIISALLLAGAGLISLGVQPAFAACLGIYFVICTCYSFFLKRIALVDIFVLALLYVIRVLSGGLAASVSVSHWLLAFSMFIFLSLACVKRYSELKALKAINGERAQGRGYGPDDIEQIANLGSASGYISALVLAMYLSSREVEILYSRPEVLWLICPVMLYWISRVWLLAHRGRMNEDPILFAATDGVSYLVAVLCMVLLFVAI